MQESTEDRQKSECISGQEQFVMEALKMMFDVRMLSEKITNLDNKVEANDKKHAAAITELRTFFVDQNLVVVDSVGELKKSIDAVIAHVNPMVDREEKKRGGQLSGSRQGLSKLTEEDVREIRARYSFGKIGYIKLGKEFGVSHSNIVSIVNRETWKHVV